MIWYYIDESITDGERRKGPYNIDEFMDFVKAGTVKNDTLVWHSGMAAWVHWEETDEFKAQSGNSNNEASAENLSEEEQIKAALEAIIAEQKTHKLYAGFFVRGAAYFVDNFILSIIGIAIYLLMGSLQLIDTAAIDAAATAYVNDPASSDALSNFIGAPGMNMFLAIWGAIQAVYFIVFTAIHSATPGKKLFHLHIEINGQDKIGWVASTLRYVASLFTQLTFMFYGIGYLIVMVDPKRRALHDWIAHTHVIYQQSPATVSKKK